MSQPLFTLLNTRPMDQAEALTQQVQWHHGQVISCPSIDIQWVVSQDTIFDLSESIDKIIFISANAVRGFLKSVYYPSYLDASKRTQKPIELYAIGRATQQSGFAHQLPLSVLSQTDFDSESLLAHPVMQSIHQQSIVIVKGEGGRTLLETTLKARGANVQLLEVYRRVPAPFCMQSWLKFEQSHRPILLLTSMESFTFLLKHLVELDSNYAELSHSKWRFLTETIVFSERIKNQMQAQGWQGSIRVVIEQSNVGILDTLLATNS
ncbi:Uroporphyrinogen-III synthase [hydrothermal vent metagenome]|uniref:uroporphyrinogen-III synthase n=1 Tax=hydrothermal vent metagenome TaxID=652676 RepID=A0A3B0VZI4_9ZZZZ